MKSYDVSAKRWFENIAFLKLIFSARVNATGLFLYLLKKSGNFWLSDVFRGYRNSRMKWVKESETSKERHYKYIRCSLNLAAQSYFFSA